jgi:hypothetical protein
MQTPAPTTHEHTLDCYRRPGVMTSAGRHAALLDGLPGDVGELVGVAQGLVVHEHMGAMYGVEISDERRESVHVRPLEGLLGRLTSEDDRPLTQARPVQERLAGNCRHFSVLTVAMLRSHGVAARARCGFGGYFGTGAFEDHWVVEYWDTARGAWVLVDAQIDDVQRGVFQLNLDTLNVPRDQFVIAGDAWTQCRAGQADPARFGFSMLDQTGYWWIAGNLIRDVAALNNMEMLPWDVWGAMPGPDEPVSDEHVAWFDQLAELTQAPDEAFDELAAEVFRAYDAEESSGAEH